MRWPIQTCFEEGKQDLGMGDDEVRHWRGWHHHMTLCVLAHGFLVRTCRRLKKTAPALTIPPVLLRSVLPRPTLDVYSVLTIVAYWQHRNHAAYVSHRKHRLVLRH